MSAGDARPERIFISYRRADSGGWARSLHDRLEETLGPRHAFRDVAMEGGVDFHEHVETLLDRCDVLLASSAAGGRRSPRRRPAPAR